MHNWTPKNIIKKIILHFLKFINYSIIKFYQHAIPEEFKRQPPTYRKAYDIHLENEIRLGYEHFKKYFDTCVIVKTRHDSRIYAIKEALKNHQSGDYYLEFGVFRGNSINATSTFLKDKTIYGFDSFEGLEDDWKGDAWPKGTFSLNKQIPKLNKNVVPVVGRVQNTLLKFIKEHEKIRINYVHMDLDTYPSTKYVLKKIKPFLKNKCIIIFDELWDFPGWRVGEYKALIEEFNENEYNFLCFSREGKAATVLQYIKKNTK